MPPAELLLGDQLHLDRVPVGAVVSYETRRWLVLEHVRADQPDARSCVLRRLADRDQDQSLAEPSAPLRRTFRPPYPVVTFLAMTEDGKLLRDLRIVNIDPAATLRQDDSHFGPGWTLLAGEQYSISWLRPGDRGRLLVRGDRFVVTERAGEERASGHTKVRYEAVAPGEFREQTFVWDQDRSRVVFEAHGEVPAVPVALQYRQTPATAPTPELGRQARLLGDLLTGDQIQTHDGRRGEVTNRARLAGVRCVRFEDGRESDYPVSQEVWLLYRRAEVAPPPAGSFPGDSTSQFGRETAESPRRLSPTAPLAQRQAAERLQPARPVRPVAPEPEEPKGRFDLLEID